MELRGGEFIESLEHFVATSTVPTEELLPLEKVSVLCVLRMNCLELYPENAYRNHAVSDDRCELD